MKTNKRLHISVETNFDQTDVLGSSYRLRHKNHPAGRWPQSPSRASQSVDSFCANLVLNGTRAPFSLGEHLLDYGGRQNRQNLRNRIAPRGEREWHKSDKSRAFIALCGRCRGVSLNNGLETLVKIFFNESGSLGETPTKVTIKFFGPQWRP